MSNKEVLKDEKFNEKIKISRHQGRCAIVIPNIQIFPSKGSKTKKSLIGLH